MGLLSACALPSHKDEAHEWKGTDDDQVWWMRWRLKVKRWFVFGSTDRCPQGLDLTFVFFPGLWVLPLSIWFTGWSWWYLWPVGILPVARRWRDCPILLFGVFGDGHVRWETPDVASEGHAPGRRLTVFQREFIASDGRRVFLSRVQLWCRWHVAVLWPLMVQAHFYPRRADVVPVGNREDRDGKIFNFYRGWHKDEIGYWGDGGFAGRNFK